jgi:hypothetical protein
MPCLSFFNSFRSSLAGLLPGASAVAFVLSLLGGSHTAGAAETLKAETTSSPTQWTISHGGKPVLVYEFSPRQFKPYVKALNTLSGYGVLRDAPFDHLHHHALMYAVAVNGVNFWEEVSGCGVEKPVQSPAPEIGTGPDGLPQATIRQTIHWLAPQDAFLPDSPKHALLIEQRTLVLTVNEATKEVALRWKSAFTLGGKTNTVTLTGPTYYGLGMRFLQELDPLANQFNADGSPDLSGTKQDVTPHAWSAVSFDRPGMPATIALFDHPSNIRSPAVFFTMKQPFAYLAATQALEKQPLVYRAGDKFEVTHLVLLYPEVKRRDFLDPQGRAWAGSTP